MSFTEKNYIELESLGRSSKQSDEEFLTEIAVKASIQRLHDKEFFN